ncbi:MAG TPA: hypothetical protein VGQ69_01835 [Gemmatimonadales bacterium]|jgi:hypothetical protein|nr:hypothetical protein [Gemmatimonadales bacterium]
MARLLVVREWGVGVGVGVGLALALAAGTLPRLAAQPVAPQRQTSAGEYTRYELQAPGSGKFRILYEVWATTAGARYYFNPIRKGSVASDEAVYDRASGAPLRFEEVNGATARATGLAQADTGSRYIRVELPRPVPRDGVSRILIDKTYFDPKSYYEENGQLVFARSLGIKRNAVVLPAGYELISANVPSQVLRESDGRVLLSFINAGPDAASLTVRARPAPAAAQPPAARAPAIPASRMGERATQTRDIVYFLRQPETHAFDLYHDYTETRPGIDKYLNVVRTGSTVSNTSALVLDTGEQLETKTLKGEAISRAKLDIGEPVKPETEVVVISFPAVKQGQSVRLRIAETYTDSVRYRVEGDELIWDRSFGRPTNAVVLPAGWYLTHSSVPAAVSLTEDGRVRLDFVNPRLDEIQVLILARRR